MKLASSVWFPNVKEVTEALVAAYGRPRLGNKRNPFDELVYILLATKTPPERYQSVYKELKRRYPRFEALGDAPIGDLVRIIQPAGFAQKRARQLSRITNQLRAQFGRVTLSPLKHMTNQEAEDFLTDLPGVGLKMARCILVYSLDRQVFPVDAHCFRISKRLGWQSPEASYTDSIMNFLQEHTPPNLRRELHIGMVVLGREKCFSQEPACGSCPILKWCPTGTKRASLAGR